MKKITYLFLVAISCINLSAIELDVSTATKIKNPLEGKVLEIIETNLLNEKLFAPSIKTIPREYKAYFEGGDVHYQETFPVISRDIKMENTRDIYLCDNIVYCLDSISPKSMTICDASPSDEFSSQRLNNMFFSYFSKFKEIVDSKIAYDISKSGNQYLISYEDKGTKNLLCLDDKSLLSVKFESRYLNGNPISELAFNYDKNVFTISAVNYADKEKEAAHDEWTVKSTVCIKIIEDNKFDKNLSPKNFGFRSIQDNRGGKNVSYLAFNKLPERKFIDDLFKNPDAVAKYNKEILSLCNASLKAEHYK